MIERVYKRVESRVERLFVATDHPEIIREVERFGGKVISTSSHHPNGTSRIFEALTKIEAAEGVQYDYILNIQGDQPFIEPSQIEELKSCFEAGTTQIATLMKKIESQEELINPSIPKVVVDSQNQALYFSRAPIPYIRDLPQERWLDHHHFYKHIGVYGFKRETLMEIASLSEGELESVEKLEQLRWMEKGLKITLKESFYDTISIDTQKELNSLKAKGLI